MPKKKTFSVDQIVDAAFFIARKKGMKAVSTRSLAKVLKTSTSPIYGHFKGIKDLSELITRKALDLLFEYQKKPRSGQVFLDMGLGYVEFARNEPFLFRDIFEKSAKKIFLNKKFGEKLVPLMKKSDLLSGLNDENLNDILFKMWIFTHGFALLTNIGAFNSWPEEIVKNALYETGNAVVQQAFIKQSKKT